MIVHPDFLEHWKTKTLIELTGDPAAPLMILRIWAHCQRQKKSVFETLNLKSICHTKMATDELQKHMVEVGFLELGENSEIIVHDWEDVNRLLRASWNNGKKGGNPSQFRDKRRPTGNPRDTHRHPVGYKSTEEDKIRVGYPRADARLGTHSEPAVAGSAEGKKGDPANVKKFGELCGDLAKTLKQQPDQPTEES